MYPFQIGSLKGYYLFHHRHISKRSVSISEIHHDALNSEPEVSVLYILIYSINELTYSIVKSIKRLISVNVFLFFEQNVRTFHFIGSLRKIIFFVK